jgi:glutaconate CoA-transferase, subunit B
VTGLCVFHFDKTNARFTLTSTHPGVSAGDVRTATGFDYNTPASVPVTPALPSEVSAMLRRDVAGQIAETYPAFAAANWPSG